MGTARFLDRNIEMGGHFADAYWLVACIFIEPNKPTGFIYLMNGMARVKKIIQVIIVECIIGKKDLLQMGIKANTSRSTN
jgi:hypothetical protein